MINKFLKSIHNFFLIFGINISFVKKRIYQSAIELNSLNSTNLAFNNVKVQKDFVSHERLAFFTEIVDLMKTLQLDYQSLDIIDVGCGMGDLIDLVQQQFHPKSCTGSDFSKTAIEIANKRFNKCRFYVHDLYEPLPNKYHFILCTEVLEHLLYPAKALHNMLESCHPVNILLTVPDGRYDTFEGHINFWSSESWRVFLEDVFPQKKITTGYLNKNQNLYAIIQEK